MIIWILIFIGLGIALYNVYQAILDYGELKRIQGNRQASKEWNDYFRWLTEKMTKI